MEDKDKFRLELLSGGNLESHYENGNFHNAKWPVGVKITLDGIVVKNKRLSGDISEYFWPGYLWQPGHLIGDGNHVLQDDSHTFDMACQGSNNPGIYLDFHAVGKD